MSTRMERTLKGLVMIGLALFLTRQIMDGTLLFYINRRFAWLTWVATILLLVMAYAYRRASEETVAGHDHEHGSERSWIPLLLVALPLLLGLLVPPRPLGAQAVDVREVNTTGLGQGSDDETVLTRAATERNILDWLRAFGAADDPTVLAGQEARVVGFVYRDEELAADRFMVSRFVISCCVADATPVGLIVSWPGSQNLSPDTWVEVRGAFQPNPSDERGAPILVADQVRPTIAPNQPYLYP